MIGGSCYLLSACDCCNGDLRHGNDGGGGYSDGSDGNAAHGYGSPHANNGCHSNHDVTCKLNSNIDSLSIWRIKMLKSTKVLKNGVLGI